MVKDFAQFLTKEASKSSKGAVASKMADMASRMKGSMSKVGQAIKSGYKNVSNVGGKPLSAKASKEVSKVGRLGIVGLAGGLAANKILNEKEKTDKQFNDLEAQEADRYKDFYKDAAAKRVQTINRMTREKAEKKPDSERLKIELARKTITLPKKLDEKQKSELAIARARMKKVEGGQGSETDKKSYANDKKNSDYSKKQYGY